MHARARETGGYIMFMSAPLDFCPMSKMWENSNAFPYRHAVRSVSVRATLDTQISETKLATLLKVWLREVLGTCRLIG